MIIKACVLYVISLTGAGFVTSECYVDESTVELHDPSSVYVVKEVTQLPKGNIYYEVEKPYVNYWTWPSVRAVYRTYPSYRVSFRFPAVKTRRVVNRRRVIRHRSARTVVRKPVRAQRKRTVRSISRSRAYRMLRASQRSPSRRVTTRRVTRGKFTKTQRTRNVSRRSRRSR